MKSSIFDQIKKIKTSEWNLNPLHCKKKVISLSEIHFRKGDEFPIANFRATKPLARIKVVKQNGNVVIEIPKLQIVSMEINPKNLKIIE